MVIIRGPWPERGDRSGNSTSGGEYNAARPAERYFDHPPHVRRFTHKPSKGLPAKLADNVEVAGISRDPWHENAQAFMGGEDLGLDLERDPANEIDPNSIKVIGVWRDRESGEVRRAQIGWVPAPLAKQIGEVAPDVRLGATLRVVFLPRRGYSPGLRFDIWQPRGGRRLSYQGRSWSESRTPE